MVTFSQFDPTQYLLEDLNCYQSQTQLDSQNSKALISMIIVILQPVILPKINSVFSESVKKQFREQSCVTNKYYWKETRSSNKIKSFLLLNYLLLILLLLAFLQISHFTVLPLYRLAFLQRSLLEVLRRGRQHLLLPSMVHVNGGGFNNSRSSCRGRLRAGEPVFCCVSLLWGWS